jgi:hypothetical protein
MNSSGRKASGYHRKMVPIDEWNTRGER